MSDIMIPAWIGDELQPFEKLKAHHLGDQTQSCFCICSARQPDPAAASCFGQIPHTGALGEHLLHAPDVGRTVL